MKRLFLAALCVAACITIIAIAASAAFAQKDVTARLEILDNAREIGKTKDKVSKVEKRMAEIEAKKRKNGATTPVKVVQGGKDHHAQQTGNRALAWAIRLSFLTSEGNYPDIEEVEFMLSQIERGNMAPKAFENAVFAAAKAKGWTYFEKPPPQPAAYTAPTPAPVSDEKLNRAEQAAQRAEQAAEVTQKFANSVLEMTGVAQEAAKISVEALKETKKNADDAAEALKKAAENAQTATEQEEEDVQNLKKEIDVLKQNDGRFAQAIAFIRLGEEQKAFVQAAKCVVALGQSYDFANLEATMVAKALGIKPDELSTKGVAKLISGGMSEDQARLFLQLR